MFRLLLRDELDSHVARPLADSRGPAQSARTVALERRPLVDVHLADLEIVGDEIVVVLRVGDGGVQELQDVPRSRSRRVYEYGTRLVDVLAANVVDHETRLARCVTYVLRARANGYVAVAVGVSARPALRLLAAPRGSLCTATAACCRLRLAGLVLGLGLALCLGGLGLGLLLVGLLLGLLGLLRLRGSGLLGGRLLRARATLRLRLLLGGLGLRGRRLLLGLLLVLVGHQRIRALSPPA